MGEMARPLCSEDHDNHSRWKGVGGICREDMRGGRSGRQNGEAGVLVGAPREAQWQGRCLYISTGELGEILAHALAGASWWAICKLGM